MVIYLFINQKISSYMIHLRAGIEEGRFEFVNIQGSRVRLNMNYVLIVMC